MTTIKRKIKVKKIKPKTAGRDPTMRYISRVQGASRGWIVRVPNFKGAFITDSASGGSKKALVLAKQARNKLLRQHVARIMDEKF